MNRPVNLTRRRFLQTGATALAASPILSSLASTPAFGGLAARPDDAPEGADPLIWAILLHLGQNMWGDCATAYTPPADKFACDEALWEEITRKSAESGLNMVVIDLGEAIQYKSHPELAIDGAWSIERLRADLERLRKLGIEPIPKLNFSSCHDVWLGEYQRMVSTPTYYRVCADLIKEVVDIFDKPRFFHLGYDEEGWECQATYEYVVIRQGELWKRDFLFFVDEVEKTGVRPWIWADYCWKHPEFLEWAPKSVLMSDWYYGENFNPEEVVAVQRYLDLDAAGFEQVPTGSNWANDVNFGKTVEFCKKNVSAKSLKGFMQTPWHFTKAKDAEKLAASVEQVKAAKEATK